MGAVCVGGEMRCGSGGEKGLRCEVTRGRERGLALCVAQVVGHAAS